MTANMFDQGTQLVAEALSPVLETLSQRLDGEYGGSMEHLWIGVELLSHHARADGRPRFPFRFQKRVSGRSRFGLSRMPDWFSVGNFSVRPDFFYLASLPVEEATVYVLSLIYQGTAVLEKKSARLGGFDARHFRSRFRDACQELGHGCAP